jgi:cytochrome c oxidase cbb3-type subunit III
VRTYQQGTPGRSPTSSSSPHLARTTKKLLTRCPKVEINPSVGSGVLFKVKHVFSPDENTPIAKERRAIPRNSAVRFTAILLLSLCAALEAQAQAGATPRQRAAGAEGIVGKKTFTSRCAGCHGLDGRGGQRAPNIASSPSVRRLSDAELAKIILNGRTDFGMPAFRELGGNEIQKVVDYLRVLQGKGATTSLAGNPQKGKVIFLGKAACFSCHRVAGQGGFVDSDLSTYARGLTTAAVRKAITDPAPSTGRVKTVTATTRDGQRISGVVRNEDNFSIQMQDADGTFHFLLKSDLEKIEYKPPPRMPADYGTRLTRQELDDLVGYLQSIKAEPAPDPEEEQ